MSTSRHDRDADPRHAFRSLLVTYPRSWRSRHEEVVLDTLIAVHADRGTSRPSAAERLQFAVDGLRVRLAALRRPTPARRFATAAALAPIPSFDQTNGVVVDARPLDEWEQVHANAAAGTNADEQRVMPMAWFRLDAPSWVDRAGRRRRTR